MQKSTQLDSAWCPISSTQVSSHMLNQDRKSIIQVNPSVLSSTPQHARSDPLASSFQIDSHSRSHKRRRTLGSRPLADSGQVFKQFKAPNSSILDTDQGEMRQHGSLSTSAGMSMSARQVEKMFEQADASARKSSRSWVKGLI